MGLWIAYVVAMAIICGCFGYVIGSQKDAGVIGACLGVSLGPFGLLASSLVDFRVQCLRCGTRLNRHPEVCPGCDAHITWYGRRQSKCEPSSATELP